MSRAPSDSESCPITVVIPTFRRDAQLSTTLAKIMACDPAPSEVVVHVDSGDIEAGPMLRRDFPQVQVLTSSVRMGPGGGRNKGIAAATHEIVVSFDDDSFPVDTDYFARVQKVFDLLPDAAVVASHITEPGHTLAEAEAMYRTSVNFVGCGVAYRRRDFIACGGYVPLAVAYGMEEVDLSLRLIDLGKKIYSTSWLRVFHDNDLSHHASAEITSGSIANLGLLVFLRYPIRYWPYGAMQVANRIAWLIGARRTRGLMSGLAAIPAHIWRHRRSRVPVSAKTLSVFLRARRSSVPHQPLGL